MTARGRLGAIPPGFREAPAVPLCPAACPFRELCPEEGQQVAAARFASGEFQRPQDCWRWHHLADLVREELGIEPPGTAAALREAQAKPLKWVTSPDPGVRPEHQR